MIDKQSLVIELLHDVLMTPPKVGVIVKGIADIDPQNIIAQLSGTVGTHLYAAAVGYSTINNEGIAADMYTITPSVEKAVLWRSNPDYSGKIIVFIKSDTDKLHSLAEFDLLTTRDLSRYLIGKQLTRDSNVPTHSFWQALQESSDYYSFDSLYEFISAVNGAVDQVDAIPCNMWRLNLLSDKDILAAKHKPSERLQRNRDLIFAIGQLSEESRKKLSRSLARSKPENKERLQTAYYALQSWYKYGNRETLEKLDLDTMQELFSASQKSEKKKKKSSSTADELAVSGDSAAKNEPIKPKELDSLVSETIVFGDDEEIEAVNTLLGALKKRFDSEEDQSDEPLPTIGGRFSERNILLDSKPTDLRKLVGKTCTMEAWGGLMETEENVLKDAISADIKAFHPFNPTDKSTITAFKGGIDDNQALFDFIVQFDEQFAIKGIETAEPYRPIIERLSKRREQLFKNIDMIMYHPILLFGAATEAREILIDYIEAWADLYRAFNVNEPTMREISAGGTAFIARALLLLDILYVKTPKEWKGILLPLHPIFLWRYYEIFKTLHTQKSVLEDEDKVALSRVLSKLPQVLSFVIANSIVTESNEDKILPCSGSIEMLPTFENKTNRYLGDDGTAAIEEVLTRWIGFAPYTKNEVRICSVDAPDLIGIIRQIKSFMNKTECQRVVYDVYLTREQNGNTELSKLDYSSGDYEIGEYIRKGKISISIRNMSSATDIKECLSTKPVHVAFYFDQSSYAIEFGPNSHNLYITPLVITYQYDFDEIQHKGSIYPSSEAESGLIGDYHKLMRSADVITNNMNPRTTYSGNADMTAVVSTIKDCQAQWLVVADRDTNNYQPEGAIPIGEMQYEKRMVNVWAASDSRIIKQYLTLLRSYNLYPKEKTLINILKEFGHIASNGLISIPRFGADTQAIDNKRKGLIGTLFAASWYTQKYSDSLVATLDDDKARLWLQKNRYGNERADLIGLHYDAEANTLYIQPIEVKTRDEAPDATVVKDDDDEQHRYNITGHATDQIASIIKILHDIFELDTAPTDMFTTARREVLKYQIVSECFRNVHDAAWQKRWHDILKRAFSNDKRDSLRIVISGILLHIKLNEATGGEHKLCKHPEHDDCTIDFWVLTAKEIQQQVLGGDTVVMEQITPDFDTSEEAPPTPLDDAIIDADLATQNENQQIEITEDSIDLSETPVPSPTRPKAEALSNCSCGVSQEEIVQLVKDFRRACNDYHVNLRECEADNAVVGPRVIRLRFKLGRGQAKQGLASHLEDVGREMKCSGIIIQDIPNSDELLLDVPRLRPDKVLFKDVLGSLPKLTSPEQLYFPLGRTPNGTDLIEDLGQMPHMLVGGSTGSGKSVFLFTMLSSLLITHPRKEDMQLILSSSKLEDFIHFEGLPHLYSGSIISDATEATRVIKEVVFEESERRGRLLAEARVANITEYNKIVDEKLAPIVVVIDEFADLADQLETKKEQNAFYKPVQRIAQAGRSRGIHLVICTQRPEAKLVPATTKAQLNGRVALRVNDGISSRMIIEAPDAQYLQKHGDMIYKNGDVIERAQGYLIEIAELDAIIDDIKNTQ